MTTPHQNECCVMCRESSQDNVCNLSNCVCHSIQNEWEAEASAWHFCSNRAHGEENHTCGNTKVQELLSRVEALTAKAYGGCTSCYGKGYSTSKTYTSGAEDFGGEGFSHENNPYIPCPKCDRGKQIERLMEYIEAHTRLDIIMNELHEVGNDYPVPGFGLKDNGEVMKRIREKLKR